MTKRTEPEDPRPVDLSLLDPSAEPERLARIARGIQRAATPELLRRQGTVGIWGELARWRRGILVASGALALAAIFTILLVRPATESTAERTALLGIPAQWSEWIQGDERPGPGDLLAVERSE